MNRKRIFSCVVGTRPEAIKMAPIILALRRQTWADVRVVATAQHREMADEVFSIFGIVPDVDLDLMLPDQSLSGLTARAVTGLDEAFVKMAPDMVIAQGDTTTVMTSAMVAFYRRIPFAHVEAGLRSCDMLNPFPEEFNRVVADRVTSLYLAPTESARENLLREGVAGTKIEVTGNSVIDALHMAIERGVDLGIDLDPALRTVLVTCHRRENFGKPLSDIITAIEGILASHPDVEILWPVHPNPNVKKPVHERLGGHPRVRLVEPLPYGRFVAAMKKAHLILSDSGGVQEEAPALGKPVLVLRRETERPEAVAAGVVKLVGDSTALIRQEADVLLRDGAAYKAMSTGASPYGDGLAAMRTIEAVGKFFSIPGIHHVPSFLQQASAR